MSFLYPLGLLGLIGVPILIIIYVIKNKYMEQTISTTYLWRLSERFEKKRRRRNPLEGLLPLILQILTVVLVSLTIAHPVFSIPNGASEYTFVLDSSASMNTERDGETRFQRGVLEIEKLINEASEGSTFTLVQAGSTTSVLYEKISDKDMALELLSNAKPSHSISQEIDAIGIAQGYFDENPGAKTYFVTDTSYESVDNLSVINTAQGEVNYALSQVEHSFGSSGYLSVSGKVSVFGKDKDKIHLALTVDGSELEKREIEVSAGTWSDFSFSTELTSFESLSVAIVEKDGLSLDNEQIIYDIKSSSIYKTLIVSDRPFFIEMAVKHLGYRNVTVLPTKAYKEQTGFGLYVFDSFSPAQAPTDGTIWLINPDGKLDNMGFGVRDVVNVEGGDGELVLTNSSSSLANRLIKHLDGKSIYISRYVECGLYRNFTTLLSYNQNPIVFAGTTLSGAREIVFAFDLHDSNIALTTDYVILMGNLLKYAFPDIIEEVSYTIGDKAEINLPAGTQSVRVDSPLKNSFYLNAGSSIAELELTEVGEYTITLDNDTVIHVYASLAKEESEINKVATSLSLQGEATEQGLDGIFDPMIIVFILLAIVFCIDWMVYCYEKYQLR